MSKIILCSASYKRSVTSKKRLAIKPEDWIVVEDTHEPIISKEVLIWCSI
ncbi:recombinase family protein [Psychrobacillus sp. NPDC093200]